jgi:hypothetical protein
MERRRPRQPPTRPLVLLADGHADTRELYATALTSLGFEATIVSDDADAFAQAWQTRLPRSSVIGLSRSFGDGAAVARRVAGGVNATRSDGDPNRRRPRRCARQRRSRSITRSSARRQGDGQKRWSGDRRVRAKVS